MKQGGSKARIFRGGCILLVLLLFPAHLDCCSEAVQDLTLVLTCGEMPPGRTLLQSLPSSSELEGFPRSTDTDLASG